MKCQEDKNLFIHSEKNNMVVNQSYYILSYDPELSLYEWNEKHFVPYIGVR